MENTLSKKELGLDTWAGQDIRQFIKDILEIPYIKKAHSVCYTIKELVGDKLC